MPAEAGFAFDAQRVERFNSHMGIGLYQRLKEATAGDSGPDKSRHRTLGGFLRKQFMANASGIQCESFRGGSRDQRVERARWSKISRLVKH